MAALLFLTASEFPLAAAAAQTAGGPAMRAEMHTYTAPAEPSVAPTRIGRPGVAEFVVPVPRLIPLPDLRLRLRGAPFRPTDILPQSGTSAGAVAAVAAIGSVTTSYMLMYALAKNDCAGGRVGSICAGGIRGIGIGAAVGAGVGAGLAGASARCSYARAIRRGLIGGAIGAAPGYVLVRGGNPLGAILAWAGATLGATLAVHPACGG